MSQTTKRVADDLEPYRQLIKIQKQLARMAKQHEQARRECDALREQVGREVIESLSRRAGLSQRIRQSAAKLFQRLPRVITPETAFRVLNKKQPSSC